jgi:hypothetical protein
VSPHYFNTMEEIARFISALKEITSREFDNVPMRRSYDNRNVPQSRARFF